MIIYSVEISLKKEICEQWVKWMKKHHIPAVMNTGLFIEFEFFQNLSKPLTYTIKYQLKNIENYYKYKELYADALQKDHNKKFKNQFSAKRSLFIKVYRR